MCGSRMAHGLATVILQLGGSSERPIRGLEHVYPSAELTRYPTDCDNTHKKAMNPRICTAQKFSCLNSLTSAAVS